MSDATSGQFDRDHPAMRLAFSVFDAAVDQGLTEDEVRATVREALDSGPPHTNRIVEHLARAAAAKRRADAIPEPPEAA